MRKLAAALLTLTLVLVATPPARAVGGGVISVLNCKFSHQLRDDPIVHPSEPGAAHSHDFFASTTTDAFSTYDSMTASSSTCPLSKDTAGYWAPSLVSPQGNLATATTLNAYYRSSPGVTVSAFPPDLKIIAGGDTFDPPSPLTGQLSLSWSCGNGGPFLPYPPDCTNSKVGHRVTGHIHFPDCLAALDSPDHRSHMTYSKFTGSRCPAGYTQVPRLQLNVRYDIEDGTGYRLSSDHLGDLDGSTLHADFWNTWDQPVLEFLVSTCLNAGKSCSAITDAKLASLGFP